MEEGAVRTCWGVVVAVAVAVGIGVGIWGGGSGSGRSLEKILIFDQEVARREGAGRYIGWGGRKGWEGGKRVGVEDGWVGIEGAEEGVVEVEAGGADGLPLVVVRV